MRTIYLLFIALIFAGSSLNDARKANEAFRNGDYEKAVELYRKAIDSEPENAMLHFNLGNAYAEMGNRKMRFLLMNGLKICRMILHKNHWLITISGTCILHRNSMMRRLHNTGRP